MKPLVVELFCGMFGWSAGFVAEGYRSVGFDIEHDQHHGTVPDGCQLVLQDVLTLHGSQFRDAAVIVASPPCQNYSYLAMPWSRSQNPNNSKAAKALRLKWETEGPDNRLFDACFRIQREAIEAAGRYIPMVVENVRGAQPWVGRSAWNYGSFHLWGDVPALMPITLKSRGGKRDPRGYENNGGSWFGISMSDSRAGREMTSKSGQKQNPDGTNHPTGSWFRIADSSQGDRGQKIPTYSDPRRNGGKGVHLTSPAENAEGTKIGGDWFSDPQSTCRKHGSRSNARKAASAQIAKIPFELARHIAQVFKPR